MAVGGKQSKQREAECKQGLQVSVWNAGWRHYEVEYCPGPIVSAARLKFNCLGEGGYLQECREQLMNIEENNENKF